MANTLRENVLLTTSVTQKQPLSVSGIITALLLSNVK